MTMQFIFKNKINVKQMITKCTILVPFRANSDQAFRKEQLEIFILRMREFLEYKEYVYEIYILEQDNENCFNKGLLLNIGFLECVKDNSYFVINNVDLFPKKECFDLIDFGPVGDDELKDLHGYSGGLGGVTIINSKTFIKANGYPNNFLQWGYEDTALYNRCKSLGIKIDRTNHNKVMEEINHSRNTSKNAENGMKMRRDNPQKNGLCNIKKSDVLDSAPEYPDTVFYTFKLDKVEGNLFYTKINFLEK